MTQVLHLVAILCWTIIWVSGVGASSKLGLMDGRWRVAGEVQPRFMRYEYCICRQELTLMSAGQGRLNKPFVMHDIILSMFPVPFLQNYM